MKLAVHLALRIEPEPNDGQTAWGSINMNELRVVEADSLEQAFARVAEVVSSLAGDRTD